MAADVPEAKRLFQLGIDMFGCGSCMKNMGDIVKAGYDDVEPDPAAAVELYREAADRGNVVGMLYFGRR